MISVKSIRRVFIQLLIILPLNSFCQYVGGFEHLMGPSIFSLWTEDAKPILMKEVELTVTYPPVLEDEVGHIYPDVDSNSNEFFIQLWDYANVILQIRYENDSMFIQGGHGFNHLVFSPGKFKIPYQYEPIFRIQTGVGVNISPGISEFKVNDFSVEPDLPKNYSTRDVKLDSVFSEQNVYIQDFQYLYNKKLIAGTAVNQTGTYFFKSLNKGKTFSRVFLSETTKFHCLLDCSSDTFYVYPTGDSVFIYQSMDEGLSWEKLRFSTIEEKKRFRREVMKRTGNDIDSVCFEDICYSVNNKILKSIYKKTGPDNKLLLSFPAFIPDIQIEFIDSEHGIIKTYEGVFYTKEGGISWHYYPGLGFDSVSFEITPRHFFMMDRKSFVTFRENVIRFIYLD